MFKLIAYNINPTNILPDPNHQKIVTELIKNNKGVIILAPDLVESTPTVMFIPSFTITPSAEATLMKLIADRVKGLNKYLVVATNVGSPMSLDEMITNNPNIQIIPLTDSQRAPRRTDGNGLISEIKKAGENLIGKSTKELVTFANNCIGNTEFFAVGRTNGPTDKIIQDITHKGYRIRYDVNSRISIANEAGTIKLTFTFKPRKDSNMAKVALIDNREIIILQKDFNLWLLGLNVLLNNWDLVVEQIKKLF